MTPPSRLLQALSAVSWDRNIQSFGGDQDAVERVERCNVRVAVWAKQLELCDTNNPAIAFVRELQIQGHYAAVLLGLGLYKPSAAAMRAMVESALYYTFFRQHPAELATLVRDPEYFIQQSDIVDYHLRHTARFREREQKLGLLSRLRSWYRSVSALVHGQVPGGWVGHANVSAIAYNSSILTEALLKFEEGEYLVHALFLATIAQDVWGDMAVDAKRELLKGLSGDIKVQLGLAKV